jgi:hypothetical protein
MERGIEIYLLLAHQVHLFDDAETLADGPGCLRSSSQWDTWEQFVELLGEDDVTAIIEARRHFNLPAFC